MVNTSVITQNPKFLASVKALISKIDGWKSMHDSHLESMRVAADNATKIADGAVTPELVSAVKVFLTKVDSGLLIHESHLIPLRQGVAEADACTVANHRPSGPGPV